MRKTSFFILIFHPDKVKSQDVETFYQNISDLDKDLWYNIDL